MQSMSLVKAYDCVPQGQTSPCTIKEKSCARSWHTVNLVTSSVCGVHRPYLKVLLWKGGWLVPGNLINLSLIFMWMVWFQSVLKPRPLACSVVRKILFKKLCICITFLSAFLFLMSPKVLGRILFVLMNQTCSSWHSNPMFTEVKLKL